MADADKVAIGQFVLRTKEYLVAVRARDGLLALTTMLFQQEIRPTDELDPPTRNRPGKAKVDRAVALVEALGADFDHDAYKDRYRRRRRRLVKDKEAGETIKAPLAPKAPGPPPDIMEALKASLDKVRAVRRHRRATRGGAVDVTGTAAPRVQPGEAIDDG
jgi:DNA end-binding protein Ku